MSARQGWPAHRPNCPGIDELVETTVVDVGASRWFLRRCRSCGDVALDSIDAARRDGAA